MPPQGWEGSRLACQVCHRWIWGECSPRGAPVLTLPAAGSSFPGACGEPVGAGANFPF